MTGTSYSSSGSLVYVSSGSCASSSVSYSFGGWVYSSSGEVVGTSSSSSTSGSSPGIVHSSSCSIASSGDSSYEGLTGGSGIASSG